MFFFHTDTIYHRRTIPRATEWSRGEDAGSASVTVDPVSLSLWRLLPTGQYRVSVQPPDEVCQFD